MSDISTLTIIQDGNNARVKYNAPDLDEVIAFSNVPASDQTEDDFLSV